MTEDYFWGLCLDKDHISEIWDPEFKVEAGTTTGEHTLLVKKALLGVDAGDGDHVIEVETAGYKTDVKFPICVLKSGSAQNVVLDLMFPDPPVSFKLIKGTGPVYLLGNHSVGAHTTVTVDDDDDEDEQEEEQEDQEDEHEETIDELAEDEEDEEVDIEAEDSTEEIPDGLGKRKMALSPQKGKKAKESSDD